MSLLDDARTDLQDFLSCPEGFGVELTFNSTPSDVVITGIGSAHHLKFDTDGQQVNSRNSHITFFEKDLSDTGYIVRNANNEVDLYKKKVSFVDSAGITRNYTIVQAYPDETLGNIYCVLVSHE
jgi:hypothetical protein